MESTIYKTCSRMNLSLEPPRSVAVTFNSGRLGNQLSSFASLYSVWKEFNILNFISVGQWSKMDEVFDMPIHGNAIDGNDWPYFIWNNGKNLKEVRLEV